MGDSTSIAKLVPMRIHICQGTNFYTLTHVEANEVEEVSTSFRYGVEIFNPIKYHNEEPFIVELNIVVGLQFAPEKNSL